MLQSLSILIAVAMIVGLIHVIRNPQWAIVLILLMFPLEQLLQSYLPFLAAHGWITNVSIGSVTLLAIVTTTFRGGKVWAGIGNPAALMILGIYLIAFAGLAWSPGYEKAYDEIGKNYPYYVVMLVLAPMTLNNLEDFRRTLIPIMWLGTAIAILIILNPKSSYWSGRLVLDVGMDANSRGNPLVLAKLGGIMALIAALYRPPQKSTLIIIVRISAFIAGLALALGSGSRGQVLAAMVAGAIFYPVANRLANPKQFFINAIGFGIVALGFMMALKLFIGDVNRERWELAQMFIDIGHRFDMVWALINGWLSSPSYWVFGLGPYAFYSLGYSDQPYVHNIVAEILCEEGLVGITLFGLMLWFCFKYWKRIWINSLHDPVCRSAISILGAITVYALFQALKQGSFLRQPDFMMWCLLLAKASIMESRYLAHSDLYIEPEPSSHNYEWEDEEVAWT